MAPVTEGREPRSRRRLLLAAFVALAVGQVAAALFLDRALRQSARRNAGDELEAVVSLKVAAVEAWRKGHVALAQYGAGYPVVRMLPGKGTEPVFRKELAVHAREILARLAEREGYLGMAVISPDGEALLEWHPAGGSSPGFDPGLVNLALTGGGPVSRIEAPPFPARPWLDVVVPIEGKEGASPAVALALRVDFAPVVDTIVHGWPVPSPTAATAMLRREGQRVRLLGDAGRVPDDEPDGYMDASLRRRPSVQAALGSLGVIDGIDYRGQPVLAAVKELPETEWRILAKKDLAEIEAPLLRPVRAIFGLVGAVLVGMAIALLAWWRRDSERVRAEQEVRDTRDRLQLALAGVHFVWDWDLAAGRLTVEEGWAEWIGRPGNVFVGSPGQVLAQLVVPDDLPSVLAGLEAHVSGEAPLFESEHRVERADGSVRWVWVRGRASRRDRDGRALRISGIVSDATQRRSTQAQLERSERLASLGTLAAGLAHEVNNPLAVVVANLDVVTRELGSDVREEVGAALAEARDGAERVRDVARSLRFFSRTGGEARRPTDLRGEIAAAERLTRNELRHHARLEVRLGDLPLVSARGHELGQVFLNLLANAAQAIPAGAADSNLVVIDARTDEAGWAIVEVRDTGSGIRPELLRRIFEPFFTTKVEGVGTGLGLSIAHSIVTSAGGSIEAESEVGRGTTIRVRLPPASAEPSVRVGPSGELPADPVGSAEEQGPTAGAARMGSPAEPPRVLVVDDDPRVARSICRILGKSCRVDVAAAADEALARIQAGVHYDAILCDLMMPEMTGMELHARLAEIDPPLATRMIFVTGGAFTPSADAFLRNTSNVVLEKPFDRTGLLAALSNVTGRSGVPAATDPV